MKKNAFKYLIVSVLSLIGFSQNASAYGDKIYYDETKLVMKKAYYILKNNNYEEVPNNEKKRLSAWRNTKTGGIRGDFFTINDQKTINEITDVYMQFFYENDQKIDVEVNFYRRIKGEAQGIMFNDEPFIKLELKRIEK